MAGLNRPTGQSRPGTAPAVARQAPAPSESVIRTFNGPLFVLPDGKLVEIPPDEITAEQVEKELKKYYTGILYVQNCKGERLRGGRKLSCKGVFYVGQTANGQPYVFNGLFLTYTDRRDAQTTIGAVLSEIPEELMGSFPGYGDMVLLTSIDGMEKLAGNTPYQALDFQLNQPCTDEIDSEVRSVLNEVTAHADDTDIVSDYEFVKLQQNDARSVLTIMLSVVIVLFVFCGAIVNNTITADIRENRRELGTLRAVGASAKELSQAYILQLFKMLGWGSAIGLGGFGISFLLIWLISRPMDYTMEFTFSPWVPILFCLVLFAVCSLNLYIKIKHETKNSIVDNIREL